jgi:hypothetical protein
MSDKLTSSLHANDLLEEAELQVKDILAQAQDFIVQTEPVHIISFIHKCPFLFFLNLKV